MNNTKKIVMIKISYNIKEIIQIYNKNNNITRTPLYKI